MMRFTVVFICLLFILPVAAQNDDEPVWFWFSTCGGPVMKIEVRLYKELIFQSTFLLCHAKRSSKDSQGQSAGKIEYSFTASRAIVWSGYRDQDDRTLPGSRFTGYLWQAGAGADHLIIGVQFVGSEMIYMNTLHIAYPDRKVESEIADGLKVITYPWEAAGNDNNQ
jgi:hypothetical protein